jgi:hypothetical protein
MNSQKQIPQLEEFVTLYGDSHVKLGTFELTLNDALAMEASFCPADPEKREDPEARLQYLAKLVGEQTLLPEHRFLLVPEDAK